MTDCPHHFTLTEAVPVAEGTKTRVITLTCDKCGITITKITTKTDAELNAELAAQ